MEQNKNDKEINESNKEFDKLKEKISEIKDTRKSEIFGTNFVGKKEEKHQLKKEKEPKKPSDKETISELTETLQRLQAEFENYKKRTEKEKQEFVKYSKADLINKILPVLDTFEIALRNVNDKEKFVKGMEMLYAQLFSTLEAEGLRPIQAIGKHFDPYFHDVMLKQKSDKEDGIVLEELQKGYMLNDKVLRHTKVKISEKTENKDNNGNKPNKKQNQY